MVNRKPASLFGASKRDEAPVRRFSRDFIRSRFLTRPNRRENTFAVRPVRLCNIRNNGETWLRGF